MGKIWPRAEPATRPGRKEAMRAPQTPDLPRSGPDPLPAQGHANDHAHAGRRYRGGPPQHRITHPLAGHPRHHGPPAPAHPRAQAAAGADWQSNPLTQVRWGIGSLNTTYGSPCAAWAHWQAGGSY